VHPTRGNSFTSVQQPWHNYLNKSPSRLPKQTQGKTTQMPSVYAHLTPEVCVILCPASGPDFFTVLSINIQVPRCQPWDYAHTRTLDHLQIICLMNHAFVLWASSLYMSRCSTSSMLQGDVHHTPLPKWTQTCTKAPNFDYCYPKVTCARRCL